MTGIVNAGCELGKIMDSHNPIGNGRHITRVKRANNLNL